MATDELLDPPTLTWLQSSKQFERHQLFPGLTWVHQQPKKSTRYYFFPRRIFIFVQWIEDWLVDLGEQRTKQDLAWKFVFLFFSADAYARSSLRWRKLTQRKTGSSTKKLVELADEATFSGQLRNEAAYRLVENKCRLAIGSKFVREILDSGLKTSPWVICSNAPKQKVRPKTCPHWSSQPELLASENFNNATLIRWTIRAFVLVLATSYLRSDIDHLRPFILVSSLSNYLIFSLLQFIRIIKVYSTMIYHLIHWNRLFFPSFSSSVKF